MSRQTPRRTPKLPKFPYVATSMNIDRADWATDALDTFKAPAP